MIDTAALRALLAETTQGEWFHNPTHACIDVKGNPLIERVVDEPSGMVDQITADCMFIAAAHNTMPALLDELDTLRSEILTLRARLGNIADLTTMPLPPDWTRRET